MLSWTLCPSQFNDCFKISCMFLSDLLVAARNVKLNPFPVWHAVDKKTDLSFVLKASEGIRTVVGSVWTVASWLCLLLCRDLSLFVLCPLWLDWFNECGTCWRSVSGVLFVCSEEDGGAEVRFRSCSHVIRNSIKRENEALNAFDPPLSPTLCPVVERRTERCLFRRRPQII